MNIQSRKSTFRLLLILAFAGNQLACQQQERNKTPLQTRSQLVAQRAETFFATFAQRADWQKFCSFYREDLVFDDITLQIHLDSLWQFKRFYDWENETDVFRKLTPEQEHLTVETLIANDSVAVARGHLNPFYYRDQLVDVEWGMDFTIWIYFDENLQIRKQIDWIEYDPVVLEGVVEHYRKNGVGALPAWLDLSR